ncbi:MAG: RecQ family ATP-dependent DNA helicase, partial [Candidatus Omnitrophica bacterium]|nr:RecQ family ATP-dependent DNA helicase [Candidatus Omnitrophota bacterium]
KLLRELLSKHNTTELSDPNNRLAYGMYLLFKQIAGPLTSKPDLLELVRKSIGSNACKTEVQKLDVKEISTESNCWGLAYAIMWLRIAGGDSVLPSWARINHPEIIELIRRLRDLPCEDSNCTYCLTTHNPEEQLKKFFGYENFRDLPEDSDGNSLQRKIVVSCMRGDSLLAIMPTGGGKSLCFQLPALIRNLRSGYLTIVISPLQALMKDQVDALSRAGIHGCAALCGILTLPERADVLRGIKSGSISLLYLSPEQLRSTAVKKALVSREIGAWVMDEAHCLSKWGHDFRPDYLYVGRYIKKLAEEQHISPTIQCFTATAKIDVIKDIQSFFKNHTETELKLFDGGSERENLKFETQKVPVQAKLARINDLLKEELDIYPTGCALVFRATRKDAEMTAKFLNDQGWSVNHFHAGLNISDKKAIQDAFLSGDLRVICATNAFGMGVDKPNIRLVVHGDTPSSIENYLQEAGRAGRDQLSAKCVLLYNEEDSEQQFKIGAFSELSRKDIAQILRGLRKASLQRHSEEIVVTTGEILRDEDVNVEFDIQDTKAEIKVRSAISWLEESGFLERNENRTNVIQARPLVKSLDEAKTRLKTLNLSETESNLWIAILSVLMNTSGTETLKVDEIAELPAFQAYAAASKTNFPVEFTRDRGGCEHLSAKVLKTLDSMVAAQILKKDTLLTAFLHYKVVNNSSERFKEIVVLIKELVKLLGENEPDPEGWYPINLRKVNQELNNRHIQSSLPLLRKLLKSLKNDDRIFTSKQGGIYLKVVMRDSYKIKVNGTWAEVKERFDHILGAAGLILRFLLASIPENTSPNGNLLVEFTYENLVDKLKEDYALNSAIKDFNSAIDRILLLLHDQEVITLQKGLSIFRSAMTIRISPENAKRKYTSEEYEPIRHHYKERIFQIHVMAEYAARSIREALELVRAYFTLDRMTFVKIIFPGQKWLLEMATTAHSYHSIVENLKDKKQKQIVTAPLTKNMLILAGPGSGKTRTVVHRCAYLLRIKRVKPQSILVCCFNHKAAVELRRRLYDLVGKDSRGVTIQTYHALALRILGLSVSGMTDENRSNLNFNNMITDVVDVLNGRKVVAGVENDEIRERLLAGFEYILVDEYQDIDNDQYEMISAIAGRKLQDNDKKLSILAVGDDDQGIYGFRGANSKFIQQFQQDYQAETFELIENYRSTKHIIDAANTVISNNRDRMKKGNAIKINQSRASIFPGGKFGGQDTISHGGVSVIKVPNILGQASAVISELQRLKSLGVSNWNDIAVLSRNNEDLWYIRALAEKEGIPVSWPLDRSKIPSLHRMREITGVLKNISNSSTLIATADEYIKKFGLENKKDNANPWKILLNELMLEWREETANEPVPAQLCVEFIYDALAQRRRDERFGNGVVLSTVHSAKGHEYNHVLLCGDWQKNLDNCLEEQRRVFYVGMTRAVNTLTIFNRIDTPNPFQQELIGDCFINRVFNEKYSKDIPIKKYSLLGLEDFYMDYAGQKAETDIIHQSLASLEPGVNLEVRIDGSDIYFATQKGIRIAKLSKSAAEKWRQKNQTIEIIKVLGMSTRYESDVDEVMFKEKLRVKQWEIPFCEVVAFKGIEKNMNSTVIKNKSVSVPIKISKNHGGSTTIKSTRENGLAFLE